VNHKHRKVLHSLFAHPISGNISPQAVESVMQELGGEIETRHGSRFAVRLNGHTAVFKMAKHSLPQAEVTQIRKFIETCGIDPEKDYPL